MKKLTILLLAFLIPLLVACTGGEEKMASIIKEPDEAFQDGVYTLDPKASTLYWEAYKLVGGHMGGISLKSGELVVQDGHPSSGSFVIDMTSITNTDIENESMRMSLVNHLKSDDFFGTADFPTARFDITRVTPYEGEENYDYEIEGDLSIKDITDSITLKARVESIGDRLTGYAETSVDRTKYGITIRSGSFFENLGDQLIKDEFTLEMELSADRMHKDL